MSKKLPRKYFEGCTAQIYYRKVDKWAEMYARNGVQLYFDTWEEAHKHMLSKAKNDVSQLEKRLASAKRHLDRVEKMTNKIDEAATR